MGFTQPCFIRKNTAELRKKIEELGYKLNHGKAWGKYLATFRFTDTKEWRYVASPEWDLKNNPDKNVAIDCGENEDLFLALAALRSDSDYMQWFTNGIMWYQCEATVFENCSLFDNEYGTQIKDGHDYHKATVPEILKHFNGTTN